MIILQICEYHHPTNILKHCETTKHPTKNLKFLHTQTSQSTTIDICLVFFLSHYLFSLQSTALRTFLSLHVFLYLNKLGGSKKMVHHVFFSIFLYDKINKNKNYTVLKSICFLCFLQKKIELEGQQFGSTE